MAGAAVPYEADWLDEDSDEEISNLGLDEVGDASFVSLDPSLPDSPPFLRNDNLLPTEGSKHHTEKAEGDGDGLRVIT
jgi:hypothetical protein